MDTYKECLLCEQEATTYRECETGMLFWLCERDAINFDEVNAKDYKLSDREKDLFKTVTGLNI